MEMPKVQFGDAYEANFENNIWSFSMEGIMVVQAGRFAILTEKEYQNLLRLAER